jgi:putative DNA primase/helicase
MTRLYESTEVGNLNSGKLPGDSGHIEIRGSLEDALPVIRERLGGAPKSLHETEGEPITFDTRRKGKRSGWVYVVRKPDGWLLTCGDTGGTRGGVQHTIFVRDALILPLAPKQKGNGAAERAAQAAQKASTLCKLARPAGNDHPYLVRKHTKPTDTLYELSVERIREIIGYHPHAGGEPLEGRILVAPVVIGDKISTVEFIDEQGRKSALKDGRKSGGYWATGVLRETGRVVLAEGVATALSIAEALGEPVVAALSVGNIGKVGRALQRPGREMVIAADLGEGGKPHSDAIEAARKLGARLCAPPSGMGKGADFNDLHVRDGLDAVRAAFERPIPAVEPAGQDAGSILQPVRPGLDERPCYWLLEESAVIGGRRYEPGVYHCGIKHEKQSGEVVPVPTETWLSSPIRLEARTTEWPDGAQGVRLSVWDGRGWRHAMLPRETLASRRYREILYAFGAQLASENRPELVGYLQQDTASREYVTSRAGWHGKQYVLPDTTVGEGTAISFIGLRPTDEPLTAGGLEDWQRSVAALAAGNPLLVLSVSLPFVGPLLKLTERNAVLVHLVGRSTTGKTTCLLAANSVVGPPELTTTWRATADGLEQRALAHCDGFLALDEVSQVDAKVLDHAVYTLANGAAKQRATVYENGVGAAPMQRWRVAALSSGEKTMETLLSLDKGSLNAGQAVRFIEVPVAERYGAFAQLHGHGSGAALADALRRAVRQYYGTPLRAFLERLVCDDMNGLDSKLRECVARLRRAVESDRGVPVGPQASRVMASMGLIALAGEMASRYGITGWQRGAAFDAALHCYRLWSQGRAAGTDFETTSLLGQVYDFITRHGDSRFSPVGNDIPGGEAGTVRVSNHAVHHRAGYYRDLKNGDREYLLTHDGIREATRGFDFRRARQELLRLGVLIPGKDRDSQSVRIGLGPGRVRVYVVSFGALNDALEQVGGGE